jgi:rfaE bifunctional protein nucleotidyltransferase chain/domain
MSFQKSFLSPPALARLLSRVRRGKKVVFTNGCFDLVHAGHLKVLERCRSHGDLLVVALNDDASVRRLKGPSRPILPLKERGALMAALKPVDFVTWFSEDTPYKLIAKLRPDVLVKGGDWKPGSIVGADLVKKVVRIPLVKGRSTTAIIQAIAKKKG